MIVNNGLKLVEEKGRLYYSCFLFFAIALLGFTIAAPSLFLDPDVAWHIAAGDYIIKQRNIPFYDPWSYMGLEQQWYNLSWVWDIAASILNNLFGFYGLSVISAIILALVCTYFYYSLLCRNYDISHDAIMIGLALSSMLFIELGCLRPQLLSCVMITFCVNKLHNFYYLSDKKSLLFLPAISMLWANSHGGFILLFVLILVFMSVAIYEKKFLLSKQLIWMFVSCVVATFINPIGYKIYVGVLRTLDSEITSYISEWRPFFFGQSYAFSMLFLVLLISGCAFYNHYPNLKIKISDWVIGFAFFVISLLSIRNFSNFAAAGSPFIAGVVDRSLPVPKFQLKLKNAHKKAIGAAIIILAIILNVLFIITKNDKRIGLSNIPVELIKYTANHYPNRKIMNDYNIGGYVILFGEGKIKHFIDGRAGTVFTEDTLKQYTDVINKKVNLLELADKHQVDGVIIHENALNQAKEIEQKKWLEVYYDKKYKLLIRNHEL